MISYKNFPNGPNGSNFALAPSLLVGPRRKNYASISGLVAVFSKFKNPSRRFNASKSANKAFTLVELLVVIAIISLLVSILLPSLQRAKEFASSTVCLSRQKSSGTACLMYANDNEDIILIQDTNKTTHVTRTWSQALKDSAFVEDMQVVLCPNMFPETWNTAGWTACMYTYGVFHTPTYETVTGEDVIHDWEDSDSRRAYGLDITKVKIPADFILLGDTAYQADQWRQIWAFHGWITTGGSVGNIHLRHINRANIACLDGSCISTDDLGAYELQYALDSQFEYIYMGE